MCKIQDFHDFSGSVGTLYMFNDIPLELIQNTNAKVSYFLTIIVKATSPNSSELVKFDILFIFFTWHPLPQIA